MKLKNGEIYMAYDALGALSNEKLPIRVSFGLAKFSIKLEPSFKAIEKIRLALVKEFGVEKDGICSVPPEKRDEFQTKLDELFGLKAEVGEVVKVKLPEMVAATCDKCHHNMDRPLEIAPNILVALDKFVEV